MEGPQAVREDRDTITMSGLGTVSVPPDRVDVRLEVVGEDRDKGRAYDQAARRSNSLIALLDEMQVPAQRRITTGIWVNRRYDGRRLPEGYRAQATVQVRMDADGPLGTLISRALTEAEANVDGPYWSVSSRSPQKLEAVRRAAADARQRAEVCAQTLGLALGRPIRIQEHGDGLFPPGSMLARGRGKMAHAAAAGPSELDVESGSVLLTAAVTVTFLLAPTA